MLFPTTATTDFIEIIFDEGESHWIARDDSLPEENEIVWVFDQHGIETGHPVHHVFQMYWRWQHDDFVNKVKWWFCPHEKGVVGEADYRVERVDVYKGRDHAVLFWSRKDFTEYELRCLTQPLFQW